METDITGDTGTAVAVEEPESTGFDFDAASDRVAAQIFPSSDKAVDEPEVGEEEVVDVPAVVPVPAVVEESPAPKSWPKEMHTHWTKTPKEVREYWGTREKQMLDGLEQYKGAAQYGKALNDVLAPYHPLLQSKGLDAPRAVADLMQAYVSMTQGTPDQRAAAYAQIGKNLGITTQQQGDQQPQIDPRVQSLEERFMKMQQVLTAQQTDAYNAALSKTTQEVEAFAADKTHTYFNELQDDILGFLKIGDSLQGAYEKAVWANPVTRAKEMSRTQTEDEAKRKEAARLNALPKKQAKSVNIGGRDTHRAPTEPLGSVEDTIRATLAANRARVTH